MTGEVATARSDATMWHSLIPFGRRTASLWCNVLWMTERHPSYSEWLACLLWITYWWYAYWIFKTLDLFVLIYLFGLHSMVLAYSRGIQSRVVLSRIDYDSPWFAVNTCLDLFLLVNFVLHFCFGSDDINFMVLKVSFTALLRYSSPAECQVHVSRDSPLKHIRFGLVYVKIA